jgi:hypothetical protein
LSRPKLLLFELFRLLYQSILGSIPDGSLLESLHIFPLLYSRELARINVLVVAIGVARGGSENQQEHLVNEHLVYLLLDGVRGLGNECKGGMSGTEEICISTPKCYVSISNEHKIHRVSFLMRKRLAIPRSIPFVNSTAIKSMNVEMKGCVD